VWGTAQPAAAQEFMASVSVQAPAVSNIDPSVFQQMQRDIMEYLNNNRFTEHVFLPEERLRVQIIIIVNQAPSNDRFEATATFQLKRPVYNSTFETLVYNFSDKDFRFQYVPFQQLQYSENTYVDNLTAMLNFHAYTMLGFDYGCMRLEDGKPFFERARGIINLAQNASEPGWKAMDGTQNRYWLIENLLNNSYGVFHNVLYTYHRQGLDIMADDVATGRQRVMSCLDDLQRLFISNPNIYITRVFLDCKRLELISMMKNAFPEDKQKFIRIMQQLDPRNMDKYNAIMQASNQR
jgi:hypothetical protein